MLGQNHGTPHQNLSYKHVVSYSLRAFCVGLLQDPKNEWVAERLIGVVERMHHGPDRESPVPDKAKGDEDKPQ